MYPYIGFTFNVLSSWSKFEYDSFIWSPLNLIYSSLLLNLKLKILLLYELDNEARLLLFEDPFVETEFIESFVDIVCFND